MSYRRKMMTMPSLEKRSLRLVHSPGLGLHYSGQKHKDLLIICIPQRSLHSGHSGIHFSRSSFGMIGGVREHKSSLSVLFFELIYTA